MPKPGEKSGCCGRGAAYIQWRDGWVAELMSFLTSRFAASQFVPIAYCPWCGTWLAGLGVAAEAAARSEPQNAAGVVDA